MVSGHDDGSHKSQVYTQETLAKVQRIADQILDLPGVEDVVTPLDAQVIRGGDEFGLEISPVAYGIPETEEDIEEFKADIKGKPSRVSNGI